MKVIKPPKKLELYGKSEIVGKSIFLAGSIERGKAVDWQTEFTNSLADMDVTVLNPRRDDWDSSWEQKITNPQFKEQVTWELLALEKADVIVMYFDPKTMSPISLLEFGMYARSGKLLVCCPEGFWRKGNVDVVCDMAHTKQFNTLQEMTEYSRMMLMPEIQPESRDIYLRNGNRVLGLHSIGYPGEYRYTKIDFDGTETECVDDFQAIEVWGNEYLNDSKFEMQGRGSFRIHDNVNDFAKDLEAEGWVRFERKNAHNK